MKARFNCFADWFGLTVILVAIIGSVVASVGYLVALVVRSVVEVLL